MIEESIKKIHFNNKIPEQNNIYITNLKDPIWVSKTNSYRQDRKFCFLFFPYCNVFTGEQFSAVTKNELLPDLIDLHLFELYLSKNKYKLTKAITNKIDKLEEKLNKSNKKYTDDNDKVYKTYKDYLIEVVKLLIYNLSDKNKLDTIKKIDKFVRRELELPDNDN